MSIIEEIRPVLGECPVPTAQVSQSRLTFSLPGGRRSRTPGTYRYLGKVGVYVQVQPMRRLPRQLIYVFAERKGVSASTSLEHIDIRYMLEG